MGEHVSSDSYTPQQRTRYRERLMQDLELFDNHLQHASFDDKGTIGLELELNLVDDQMEPATTSRSVLDHLSDEYQSEIGAFNVELNLPPQTIDGDGLLGLQAELENRLAAVREAARQADSHVAMVGTLPTLSTEFLSTEGWMTGENRYRALSNTIMEKRGELVHIDIAREDHYHAQFQDIAPESGCTSMQLHLQVKPSRFADVWNASQAIAGVQVATGANSPLFAGHRLWHETRIPLFKQAIDTRTSELVNQGVRPRVWFGERWITSVFDLFEENVRYFSPLLPEDRSDSGTPMMTGDSPALHYLNLHNGTVWRWNRPIYQPGEESSHFRIENRLLPAGPTPVDIVADAAFYYGLVEYLSNQTRPVWSRMSFAEANSNFEAGARDGLNSIMSWPTLGRISVIDLVNNYLVDQAREGLMRLGVSTEVVEKYMNVISGRMNHRQNGASWQLDYCINHSVPVMLRRYLELQATGEPVHTWPLT